MRVHRLAALIALTAVSLAACASGPSARDLAVQACQSADFTGTSDRGPVGDDQPDIDGVVRRATEAADLAASAAAKDDAYRQLAERLISVERYARELADFLDDHGADAAVWSDVTAAAMDELAGEWDDVRDPAATECRIVTAGQ